MTTNDIDAIEARLIAPRYPDTGDYLLSAIYALKTLPLVCAEVRELRAALEAAKSQREAYKLSVYELREQLRHSVSEDALASAQDDLAGCRAALERERMELASASVSVSRARERTLAQEIRANDLSAALEVAQAKADVIGGQACAEARAAGRGPCGCCAWCVKQATERAERSEALIKAHNERVEAACNARRKHPNCAEHAKLGTTCANCPREWMIDND